MRERRGLVFDPELSGSKFVHRTVVHTVDERTDPDMSFMFKPPAPAEDSVGRRDLFRLGPVADPFWSRVRASQMRALARNMLFGATMTFTHIAVVLATFAHMIAPDVILVWLSINVAITMLWLLRAIRAHRRSRPLAVAPECMRRLLGELLLMGVSWGLLYLAALPVLPPAHALLVVAMTMSSVSCAAFASATFPTGALALSVPIMLGTMLGVAMSGWPESGMIMLVVGCFILVVLRSTLATTWAFLARMHTQDRLKAQEEMVRLLLDEFDTNGRDWLFEFNAAGQLIFCSSRFADATRLPMESLLGMHWKMFVGDSESAAPLTDRVRGGQPFRDHLLRVNVAGEVRWWSVSGSPRVDIRGRTIGYRGVGSDVTDRQLSARRIADLATFDTLTGLVNRRVIHNTLSEGLASPEGVTLLFIDLDRFKAVNDSLGHGGGDRLLAEVAARLRQSVDGNALVGRLGGDEFAIVRHSRDANAATALGEAIIASLSEPYAIGDSRVVIGASIGLAIGPNDAGTVEGLMRAADLALYDVKGKGRGSVRRYDRAMHRRAEERRSLELDLRNALSSNQLRMTFQPVVEVRHEQVVGFEALMRWRHPRMGEVPPATFIPLAEEAGLIGSLGSWALEEACRVASGWPEHIRLSVNLSPLQFDNPRLADEVAETLRRWNIAPGRLELELTERLFLENRPEVADILEHLHRLGVGFALDDFGTGYASLGYLQKFAFTRIKIDRSFVQAGTAEGSESATIVSAIVALAERLGMETTAEGTETRAEFEAMRRLGCAQVQGYYFGRPVDAPEVHRLLKPGDRESAPVSQCTTSAATGHARWQMAAAETSPPHP